VACRAVDGSWTVSARKVRARAAARLCRRRRKHHAVPRTGYEAQLLKAAMARRAAGSAWLGYRHREGEWVALDFR
jgi:hypothetical protein